MEKRVGVPIKIVFNFFNNMTEITTIKCSFSIAFLYGASVMF